MSLRFIQTTVLLALLAAPLVLKAQTSAAEEERLEQLLRAETVEAYAPKSTVTVGFRMLTSGATVNFGNLGSVVDRFQDADGQIRKFYDNGYVDKDSVRAGETAATTTTLPNGRYQTSVDTKVAGPDGVLGNADDVTVNVITGNYLSYIQGSTRSWSYYSEEQALERPGYIAMNRYSALSEGGSFEKKQGASAGVELQFSRSIRKLTKRIDLSFVVGIALNSISSKTSGDVTATLRTETDYYSLNGQAAPELVEGAPYVAPLTTTVVDPNDSTLSTGLETTTPLNQTNDPTLSTETEIAGGATVHGNWKIKGAYFMMRAGPSLRAQLTQRLGLSASVGLAGAYAGTRYTADETFEIPVLNTVAANPTEFNDAKKFLTGYYADMNLDWAANDTLGIFGGVSAQQFGDYNQTLAGRTALIDLGQSVGLRGGVTIKF